MCGIWGYVGLQKPVAIDDAWAGLCSIEDRGPDDWGVFVDGEGKVTEETGLPEGSTDVVLGNRRLSILDLSAAGNQPITADGRYWITYNGEVYNYRELRDELESKGYEFDSDTDTEVILRAYQAYGADCVGRFRGMFAFAIWDTTRDTLFAARDRFGIKPFYYAVDDDRFVFTSELTSLLESGVVTGELDLEGVDGFLTLGYVPGPGTIVDSVESLPPGSTLRFDRTTGDLSTERYWSPTFDGQSADPDRLRELLEESIRLRLRSDVPVGAFLSGGLDSSTIVAMMRAVSSEGDLRTFSIDFHQEPYSETTYAEEVADAFGTDHYSHTVTADDVRKNLDDIIASMDQPSIDGVNTYFVSKVTADNGLKVALSGLGSDELFFGYPSFERTPQYYAWAKRMAAMPRPLGRTIGDLVDWLGRHGAPGPFVEAADLIDSDHPFGAAYLGVRGLFSKRQRNRLLTAVEPIDWDGRLTADLKESSWHRNDGNSVSALELSWYMRDQLLRDTDAMSMSHSLEVRVPFLDSRLSEYAMGLSASTKARGEKQLLKDAVRSELPAAVLDREKTGFTFPFAEWLSGELRDVLDSALEPERLGAVPIDSSAVADLVRRFDNGDVHWSRVWALAVLTLWTERHLHSN